MLACSSCGRAFNARALNPWSLSTATCPTCGGDLAVKARKRPITAKTTQGRFTSRPAPRDDLAQRLSGLGA
jgi:DNA-directed RNA polymerase subunit RPC12/RpoP